MPYVRKFSAIPRIVPRRRGWRGMGAGDDDSGFQAQGPLAPGQSSIISSTVVNTSGGTYTVSPSGQILDSNGNVVTNSQILSGAQFANINTQNYQQGQLNPDLSAFFQQYQTPILIAGISLFALAIFKGGR